MKYVAYYRVSTNKQELGIIAQKKAVNDFIERNNDNILIDSYEEKEKCQKNQKTK